MMAEALGRWLREEMQLPPSAAPSPAVLRRLCSGPTAPIWDFVTRRIRSQRNVKKIRGNLRWYRHLQELEAAAGPPSRKEALVAEVARLRKELQDLGDAIEDSQEEARRLEASLEERQSRRWAELRRGAELRLLAAEPSPDWLRGGYQRALEAPPQRPGQSRAELTAILASGSEPEVLVSIKALFKAREAELHRPHPPRQGQKVADDWLEQAQAVLIGHSPQAVLWALEVAANQSVRELLVGPAPFPEAPPTLRSQIQGCWWSVGGVWAQLPPLLSHLGRLRQRLQHLEQHLEPHLGTQGSSSTANRLLVTRAGLVAFLGSLLRAVHELRGGSPKSPKFTPKTDPEVQPKSDPKSDPELPESEPKLPEFAPKLNPKLLEFAPNSDPKFDPKWVQKSEPISDPKSPKIAPKSDPKSDPELPELDPKSDPEFPEFAPKLDPKLLEFAPNSDPKFDPKWVPKSEPISDLKSPKFAPKSDPKSAELAPNSEPKLDPELPESDSKSDPKLSKIAPKLDPKSDAELTEFGPKSDPKLPKIAPKLDLKSDPELMELEPKSDPELPEFAPKLDQELSELDPKSDPKLSKVAPKLDPKSTELAPKSDQKLPKIAPKLDLKLDPEFPEFAPNSDPKFDPKWVPKSEPTSAPKSPEFAPKSAPKSPEFAPKSAPKSPEFAPKRELGQLRRRLQRGRGRVLWLQQRLRFLSATSRGRRAGLRPLQEQVVALARAGLGSAPPLLEGEGRRRCSLELGALGQPLPHPGTPPPLQEVGRELGAEQGALLPRAAILKQQLRQGALRSRRGAGLAVGAGPELRGPPLPHPEGAAELLPGLRLVGANCRQQIGAWPRLRELVSQWWTQPAQWVLATPPGHAPFSHWLQRWRDAVRVLEATPTIPEATPTDDGNGAGPAEGAPAP